MPFGPAVSVIVGVSPTVSPASASVHSPLSLPTGSALATKLPVWFVEPISTFTVPSSPSLPPSFGPNRSLMPISSVGCNNAWVNVNTRLSSPSMSSVSSFSPPVTPRPSSANWIKFPPVDVTSI